MSLLEMSDNDAIMWDADVREDRGGGFPRNNMVVLDYSRLHMRATVSLRALPPFTLNLELVSILLVNTKYGYRACVLLLEIDLMHRVH